MAGGIAAALKAAQERADGVPIEIEVDTLAQFTEALDSGAQIVLLDNMPPDMLRAAVELNKGRAVLEASGRVNEDTVLAIAESGVDYILSVP